MDLLCKYKCADSEYIRSTTSEIPSASLHSRKSFFFREKNLYKVSVLLILPRLMRVRGKSVAAVANETIFTGCGF